MKGDDIMKGFLRLIGEWKSSSNSSEFTLGR